MSQPTYTALVLAASRGNLDPLAQAGGVSHKCFIDIAGRPMLAWVVEAVAESGRIGHILLSIEEEAIDGARAILDDLGVTDRVTFVPSRDNIASSVAAVTEAYPEALPLVITTGDNALHTAEMVRFFCDALPSVSEDAAIGLTPASYVLEKYPEGSRAFHRFRDGAFSSCNIYALLTRKALDAPQVFRTGGQFGKKPKRLIGAFGIVSFILYKSRLVTLRTVLKFLSRAIGVRTAPVLMPFAEGPIDVDRMQDWKLAEQIIKARTAA